MILLRDHKVLFLKPRKVAGTSFEMALSKFAGPRDVITRISPEDEAARAKLGFRGAQNFKFSLGECLSEPIRFQFNRGRGKFYNHMPANQARDRVGLDVWRDVLKVSIVRNPFDKMVSAYFWARRREPDLEFADWAKRNPRVLTNNQVQYYIGDRCVIDWFIRYEHLEEDIRKLEEMRPGLQGLYETFSGLSAKGGVRPETAAPSSFFADLPELVAAVRFYNAREIDRFGYTLD